MGSYVSCALSRTTASGNSAVQFILSTGGDVRTIDGPANAAELMLDNPNYFVVSLQSLQIGRRFSPLSADEELEMGGLYVLFPMSRVNSLVKPADMAGLFMKASNEMKKSSGGGAKVLPEVAGPRQGESEEVTLPRLSLEGVEDVSVDQFKRRLSACRSREAIVRDNK